MTLIKWLTLAFLFLISTGLMLASDLQTDIHDQHFGRDITNQSPIQIGKHIYKCRNIERREFK